MLRLDASPLDYGILVVYFAVVLGIGLVARLTVRTDVDFFLSGRSLPAWITGLAFVSANLGALEILGMAANAKQPLLPAYMQSFIAHRLTDLGGAAFAAFGAALFLALATYNAQDPSFNTAGSSDTVHNIFGRTGAYSADILLQTLGFASYLLATAFIVWGWRIVKRKPVPAFGFRLPALICAVLFGAIALARVPSPHSLGIGSYMGGSAGALIFAGIGNHLQGWLGAMAFLFVAISAAVMFSIAYLMSLGISLAEWGTGLRTTHAVSRVAAEKTGFVISTFRAWHAKYTGAPVEDVKLGLPYIDRDGRLLTEDIGRQIDWYVKNKMVEKPVDPKTVYDISLVETALQQLK